MRRKVGVKKKRWNGKNLKMERWKGRKREGSREKMKITHLEQSLLNYSPHILSPLGYVRVELVQIRGER